MRDDDDADAEFFAHEQHLLHDLLLDMHVQRAGGLVRHEDAGAQEHGRRDADALLHAAGELEGIAFQDAQRIGKADLAENFGRAVLKFRFCDLFVLNHALVELGTHSADRAEGGAGALEDHSDVGAAELSHLGGF